MCNLTVQTLSEYDERVIAELVELQEKTLPEQMRFPDPARYYEEGLKDRSGINVVLKDGTGRIVGHLLAFQLSSVFQELKQWDPALENDPETIYLDLIHILPDKRHGNGLLQLVDGLCEEAERRYLRKYAMHARVKGGLSKWVRRHFPTSRRLRRIENWYGTGEPFDYIECTFVRNKSLVE